MVWISWGVGPVEQIMGSSETKKPKEPKTPTPQVYFCCSLKVLFISPTNALFCWFILYCLFFGVLLHCPGTIFIYTHWDNESRLVRFSGPTMWPLIYVLNFLVKKLVSSCDDIAFVCSRHILLCLPLGSWHRAPKLIPTCGEFRYIWYCISFGFQVVLALSIPALHEIYASVEILILDCRNGQTLCHMICLISLHSMSQAKLYVGLLNCSCIYGMLIKLEIAQPAHKAYLRG